MRNFKRKFSLVMIILFTISICNISDYRVYADTVSSANLITQVSLSETKSNLSVGSVQELIATVYPSKTASQIVKWTSSNSKVATVSSVEKVLSLGKKYNSGVVKALSAGNAIITATTADGSKKATCIITVTPSILVKSVQLNKNNTTLVVGAYEYLESQVYPDDATDNEVLWTTSNPAIATVNSYGKVTALSVGTATIKATTSNKKTSSCIVNVTKATSVVLNKTSSTLAVGGYEYLSAMIYPNNGVNRNSKWTSSNPSVATVSSLGQVAAIGVGSATITVTTGDGSKKASCNIKVTPIISVTSVQLNKNNNTLTVGEYEYLSENVYPSNATNKKVKWTSSNSTVASVTSYGQVNALSVGTALITVTTEDGNEKATYTLNVKAPVKVTSVALSKTKLNITPGSETYLSASVYPSNATNKNVEWTSSNPDIAKVGYSGQIIALKAGTVTITVKNIDSDKKATCVVTVSKPTSINLNKYSSTLIVGQNTSLYATVYPRDNNGYTQVNWTSSNSKVAKVSNNGEVEGIGIGTAIITATTIDGSKKATCTVKVNSPVLVSAVALDKVVANLTVDEVAYLDGTVYPSNATNKEIVWTSSNNSIATVTSYGEVKAVSVGTTTITATTVDGSKKATCTINVKAPVSVTSVTLDKTTSTLTVGGYNYLNANIYPVNATNKNVEWISSNPKVAKVSYDGSITALSVGTTTITATTADGNKTAKCVVTVKEPVAVTSITLNKSTSTLMVGDNTYLNTSIKPSNAANQSVKWTSSNSEVATVTSYGHVSAVSAGTATITATTADGNKTAKCIVTVKPPIAVTSVVLNKFSDTIIIGNYGYLSANVYPINATNQEIEWTSSNTEVATVSYNGDITAVSVGTATITATTVDGSKKSSCILTVKAPVAVTAVTLNKSNSTLTVGEGTYLNTTIKPSNAANKSIRWVSSNPAIATVSNYGEVTAVSAGTATITATTVDGNKTATCVITVKAPIAVTSVGLNKINENLLVGGYTYLSATVYPSNAANRDIEWTSSNTDVATVNSYGEVTAISAGITTITVTTDDGGKTQSCTIKVTLPVAVTSITLNKTKTILAIGDYEYLESIINPTNAYIKEVEWTSSNLNVAVVNYYGEVTAVGKGTATITATTIDGNKKASCVVTVN